MPRRYRLLYSVFDGIPAFIYENKIFSKNSIKLYGGCFMIPFALRENLLTADPDDCMAQVVSEKAQIFTQDKIDAEIIKRGGISEAALAAVRQSEKAVYADIIADGGVISTDLFSTSFSISVYSFSTSLSV